MWSAMRKFVTRLIYLIVPVALIALILMFFVQSFTGEFGRPTHDTAIARQMAAQNIVRELEQDLLERQKRNAGLRDQTINLDLLDERLRAELGMIRDDEVFLLDGAGFNE